MTPDKTELTEPETEKISKLYLKKMTVIIDHYFEQGDKLHAYCDMLTDEKLIQALHSFLKTYHSIGTTFTEYHNQAMSGNTDVNAEMVDNIRDLNGYAILLKVFDEVLANHVLMPGSEAYVYT